MSAHRVTRTFLIVLAYWALFLLFDALATFVELTPGTTLWYPAAGVSLALLILFGLPYLPALLVALLASGLLINTPPIGLRHLLFPTLVVVLCNGAAAAWLRRLLPRNKPFAPRAILPFILIVFLLTAATSSLSSLGFVLTGLPGYTWDTYLAYTFSGWIGDTVGIFTITPLLIFIIGPRTETWTTRSIGKDLWPPLQGQLWIEFIIELGGIVLALYLAFFAISGTYYFYFCFLPLLWMGMRHGLPRITLALTLINIGAVLAIRSQGVLASIGEFQLFMLTLALTGLLLGTLTSENGRLLGTLQEVRKRFEWNVATRTKMLEATTQDLERQLQEQRDAEEQLQRDIAEEQARQEQLADALKQLEQLNEKLETSEKQLKESNDRKDKFFSIVSHDVKNMLVSSIGFSQLLISDAETLPRDMIQEFAAHIHDSSSHTYDLLENLQNWARMQTGRMYYQRAWYNVHDLIRSSVAMLKGNATQKDITLESQPGPEVHVYVDRNMINSVLQNLITNAIKFTKRGGRITVSSRIYNHTVEICVADTGIGINPENLDKLFRIDIQYTTQGTEDEVGTGLGLILCKEVIEHHEGRIWAESELGNGSSFHFVLPCVDKTELPI